MTLAGAWMMSGDAFDIARALTAEAGGARPGGAVWHGPGVVLGAGSWGQVAALNQDAVAADLRIDNRDALWPLLAASHEGPAPAPVPGNDALLVLLAWRKWGETCFDRLYGDMACALWDGRQRRLVLVRDAMAMRPLDYARLDDARGRGWLFASTSSGMLCDDRVETAPDERYIAQTLCQMSPDPDRTPYRAMSRVPPGHGVVLDDQGGTRRFRHWHPDRIAPLRLGGAADYADAMRQQLDRAVRDALPPRGAVGAELSGGLDSSTVTALAARALAETGRSLTAFTSVPAGPVAQPDPRRIDDESGLAGRLAAAYPNIDHQTIPSSGVRPLFVACTALTLAGGEMVPATANILWADALALAAQRRGIRVLLVGSCGNMTFSYHGMPVLPRLLAGGRWGALVRQWRGLGRWNAQEWPWARRLYWTVAPLLPPALTVRLRRLAGRPVETGNDFYPFNPGLAGATGVGDAGSEAMLASLHGLVRDGRAWRLAMLRDDGAVIRTRRLYGFEVRDPSCDRRLFELCLAIPEDQFLHDGEPRSLARRVMAGLVPDEIRLERRTGRQSADWHCQYDAARDDFVAELARLEASPLARRILDLPRLRRLIADWPEPAAGGAAAADWPRWAQVQLMQGFGTGLFLRQFDRGNGGPAPEPVPEPVVAPKAAAPKADRADG